MREHQIMVDLVDTGRQSKISLSHNLVLAWFFFNILTFFSFEVLCLIIVYRQ